MIEMLWVARCWIRPGLQCIYMINRSLIGLVMGSFFLSIDGCMICLKRWDKRIRGNVSLIDWLSFCHCLMRIRSQLLHGARRTIRTHDHFLWWYVIIEKPIRWLHQKYQPP